MRKTSRTTLTRDGDPVIPVIMILLIALLAACLYQVSRELYEYKKARTEYTNLDEQLISQLPDENSNTEQENGMEQNISETEEEEIWWPELEIDHTAYASINSDYVGILYFPLFDMRYPVAISRNNTEYLTMTFEGQTNGSGCIFMDYQNDRKFMDRSTYLYGHNMRDGSMFGSLKRLIREPELCEGGPKIYVYTPDHILEYQLYAVELMPAAERLPGIFTDLQYDTWLGKIMERASFVDHEQNLSDRPDMLTLYTCWGTDYRYKLLVHGIQTRKKELHPRRLYPVKERKTYGREYDINYEAAVGYPDGTSQYHGDSA